METNIVKTQNAKALLGSVQKEPIPIFGNYIFENELSLLFGDSNTGKSILATDIAMFVSGGGHEWPDMVSPKLPSLYIDMEMTEQQFANRYRNAALYMTDSFYRSSVDVLGTTESKIFSYVKSEIITQQGSANPPKFIVIDNITNGFGSIFSAAKMRTLISEFKALKNRFGLTILLIAHCPKRSTNKPITDNNLGGSKMIMNFVDSAFAIGPSQVGNEFKYIKQIKSRAVAKTDEVMTVKISKEPYLSMQYVNYTYEDAHIDREDTSLLMLRISPEQEIKLLQMHKEKCKALDIANKLGLTVGTIYSYLLHNHLL